MYLQHETPEQKRKQLRHFGLLVGAVFALIGFWQLYRGQHEIARAILWSIGGLLMKLGLIVPKLLGPIHAGWMKLAFVLGWVNSRILLSIIFFLLFTPIALITRVFGRDSLDRRINRKSTSYWKPRPAIGSIEEHCERQY